VLLNLSGIGKSIVMGLAGRGATVYMICRSLERAEQAKRDLICATGNENLYILLADCALEKDVRRVWQDFIVHRTENSSSLSCPDSSVRLDALVCNAGALLKTKNVTSEGIESTFASHLLFGTYLLGMLAMSSLKARAKFTGGEGSARLIVVSSGGMYNTSFPGEVIGCSI
jgi:NAD(P)-dependent dehydrogenase (short-subunit alcohol dehydrogenase family)